MLAAVARRVERSIRVTDVFGRVGGEEFALLPETDIDGALQVAERIRAAVAAAGVSTAETVVDVTLSLGVASVSRFDTTIDTALQRADVALYDAKRTGRNRVRCAAAITRSMAQAA